MIATECPSTRSDDTKSWDRHVGSEIPLVGLYCHRERAPREASPTDGTNRPHPRVGGSNEEPVPRFTVSRKGFRLNARGRTSVPVFQSLGDHDYIDHCTRYYAHDPVPGHRLQGSTGDSERPSIGFTTVVYLYSYNRERGTQVTPVREFRSSLRLEVVCTREVTGGVGTPGKKGRRMRGSGG